MSLSDVVRVKKIADDINFMRMFYLKSAQDHLDSSSCGNRFDGLEIIDSLLSIFLFEISRVTKNSVRLYDKN